MALSERRVLKEVTLLVDRGNINVMWADEILKDSVVVHTTEHRGAYPLNDDGEVDDTVAGLLDGTLEQIIGSVATGLQQNLVALQGQVEDLQTLYSTALHERDEAVVDFQQASALVGELRVRIAQLEGASEGTE